MVVCGFHFACLKQPAKKKGPPPPGDSMEAARTSLEDLLPFAVAFEGGKTTILVGSLEKNKGHA